MFSKQFSLCVNVLLDCRQRGRPTPSSQARSPSFRRGHPSFRLRRTNLSTTVRPPTLHHHHRRDASRFQAPAFFFLGIHRSQILPRSSSSTISLPTTIPTPTATWTPTRRRTVPAVPSSEAFEVMADAAGIEEELAARRRRPGGRDDAGSPKPGASSDSSPGEGEDQPLAGLIDSAPEMAKVRACMAAAMEIKVGRFKETRHLTRYTLQFIF